MKQCKVDFHSSDSVEVMEELLLESIIKDMWEKLSQSERIALLSDLKDDIDNIDFNSIGGITSSMLIQVFSAGGFASYRITLIIVTHDESLAAKCDRQIRIQDGQIVSKGEK